MLNKILIVDDEPFNLDLLEQELADKGYAAERAINGTQALQKIDSLHPDLILLDYQMPDMNGLEVLKEIRRRGNDVPVVMITAYGTIERAVVLGEGPRIDLADLPARIALVRPPLPGERASYREAVDAYRRELIVKALKQAEGNHAAAAKLLGLHRTHLFRLVKALRIG